jgi:hypothetical protein
MRTVWRKEIIVALKRAVFLPIISIGPEWIPWVWMTIFV